MPDLGRGIFGKHIGVRQPWEKHWCRRCGRRCSPVRSGRAAVATCRRHCAARGRRCRRWRPLSCNCRARAWGEIRRLERACALVAQSASGLTWPLMLRVGSWQARHSWPLELSLTRKFRLNQVFGLHVRIVAGRALDVATDQLDCAGSIGGLVVRHQRGGQVDIVFQRHARLNGCDDCMLLPNTSAEFIDPFVVTWP